ncbi:MAG TPA: helix-turn-helix domain-containing protein, partial [Arsenophonus nasoniae]|uniref:helix-turn-helix domain-containing protein n=1 Tax=Arsenophonus nasoniae TaxID=638 RepID=UPI003879DD0F
MSMTLMVQAMKMKVGSTARKLVLLKLADNANDKGECFPSYKHIAEQCEMSRKTAIGHIDALCEMGLVKKIHRGGEKGNSSNIYKLNLASVEITPPSVKITPEVVKKLHHPSVTVTPPPSVNITPRISHSFEPINEPIKNILIEQVRSGIKKRESEITKANQDLIDLAFEGIFWPQVQRKVGKQSAKSAFKTQFRLWRKETGKTAEQFAEFLVADIRLRLQAKQFGFEKLHPATY